jgi:hypothetical protein
MEPTLTLFLAAIVFGAGFGLGNAIISGLIGLVNKR